MTSRAQPLRARLRQSRGNVRAARWPILQTAVGAGASWYIAHTLLGHPQPFFAPIAAALSLGAMNRQRGRRAVQLVLGVCIGIVVGEALHELLGTGALSIGLVTLVTMNVAVALGWGFVGDGMMFVNQATASAILVIALTRTGTGTERFVDALVGGTVSLVMSQLLFPPDPVALVARAEHDTLAVLADTFEELVELLRRGERVDAPVMLHTNERVHRALGALGEACSSARHLARYTRRRVGRPALDVQERRAAHLELLGNDLISLMRLSAGRISAGPDAALPAHECDAIADVATAVRLLGTGDAGAARRAARAAATLDSTPPANAREAVVAELVGAAVRDVRRLAGEQPDAAPAAVAAGA